MVTYKGKPIRLAADFSAQTASQKVWYIQRAEWEKSAAKNTLSSKANIQNRRRSKFYKQELPVPVLKWEKDRCYLDK